MKQPLTQALRRFAVRLAVRLLASRYTMLPTDTAEGAYKTALHDLQHQNQALTNERNHWKLRASIRKYL